MTARCACGALRGAGTACRTCGRYQSEARSRALVSLGEAAAFVAVVAALYAGLAVFAATENLLVGIAIGLVGAGITIGLAVFLRRNLE